jgi:Zn-dependent peptidase ImmA (M78 family)
MRFTLAHELGHAVLHRELYEWYAQSDVNDVIGWTNLVRDFQVNADPFFERQANEFAGRLLVPREPLKRQFEELLLNLPTRSFLDLPEAAVRDHIAQKLYRHFQVNVPAVSARLKIGNLYPIADG